MIDAIKGFLENIISIADSAEVANEQSLIQLAAAVLFVEIIHADHRVEEQEREAVNRALQSCFSMTTEEAQTLMLQAEERVKDVTSLHEFTSLLHQHLDSEEKVLLIEQIWRIILADEDVDKYEEHLVRRIAELLYVSHTDYIRAKLRAEANN